MTFPNINHPAGGISAQPPVGQDEIIALLKDLVEAQQDANGIMRDVKSEIVTLRRVVEEDTNKRLASVVKAVETGAQQIIDQVAVSAPD